MEKDTSSSLPKRAVLCLLPVPELTLSHLQESYGSTLFKGTQAEGGEATAA